MVQSRLILLIIHSSSQDWMQMVMKSENRMLGQDVWQHIRRAQEAKERAEERLRQHQSKMEYYRSTASLSRAMARLKEANKYRHS